MKETCNCCKGIHRSSPAQLANRPGLFALSYRVGTHATFLETMKARLSNLYLEDDEPRGRPLAAKAYPLSGLATRDGDDPAIALLDAWATVADVLTFYQERIANEGYLRTATERRSVLELARLVGYQLRPGVAAGTYLAYILEKGSIVTIPAGSRAQSVPGPGETLQSFETSVDLPARTEWSMLRPRLTRPQDLKAGDKIGGSGLYFKGITTNLKPNDAVLIDFGGAASVQALYRVVAIEPDAEADRTKVTLQPWGTTPSTAALSATPAHAASRSEAGTDMPASADEAFSAQDGSLSAALQEIVERHSKEEEVGDLLKTRTGGRVLEQLELLRNSEESSDTELARLVVEDVLPALQEQLRVAQEGRFTRLEPWIQQVITDLETAVRNRDASAEDAEAEAAAGSDFASSASASNADDDDFSQAAAQGDSGSTDLEYLLSSLGKPPSIPPANPQRLERSLAQTFSHGSDIVPNILAALRPSVAPLLLKALENRPTPKPATARVYVMRARASVFGHNAPLQNVTDANGKVTGQKEWTLSRFGAAGTEDFRLEIKFLMRRPKPLVTHDDPIAITGHVPETTTATQPETPAAAAAPADIPTEILFQTKIEIGAFGEITHPTSAPGEILTPHEFNIFYDAAGESPIKAKVELPPPGDGNESQGSPLRPFILTFWFNRRQITLLIDAGKFAEPRVTSVGLDPFTFKFVFSAAKIISPPEANPILMDMGITLFISGKTPSAEMQPTEKPKLVSLDAPYPLILPSAPDHRTDAPESWVALELPGQALPLISRVLQVKETSRADYGIALKSTQLTLEKAWLEQKRSITGNLIDEIDLEKNSFEIIRGTTVFAQSELMELSEAPLDPLENPVCGGEIELDGFYSGLEAGRWLIITGERADITPYDPKKQLPSPTIENVNGTEAAHETAHDAANETVPDAADNGQAAEKPPVIGGLKSAELVMLAGLRHNNPQNDKSSTTLLLANAPAYCYKRDTVTIYGNVAHATHGETRAEVLGSGDASLPLQSFTLKQPPLTFVSAPTVSGIDTTLKVRVNDILWHEAESLAELGPKDRRYLTRTSDDGKTLIIFGNGENGARPATGVENITAVYRNGIGRAGNVKAEQITLLATKPLGVKDVINPIPATGGAEKEDRDTARRNTPLAVMSLDRLVSVQDYEDYARTFAGLGKASAARLSDGRRRVVFLTIAGADDIPIAETSDLFQNLRLSLHKFGDPFQAVQIRKRKLKLLILSGKVKVHPDYLWEKVEPVVRAALLAKFSFAERELGQDALLSEAVSAMQAVEGVVYVDVDMFGAVDEGIVSATPQELQQLIAGFEQNVKRGRIVAEMARVDEAATEPDRRIIPAELVIISPGVADTIILKEVKA
jgi:hypothetical protein